MAVHSREGLSLWVSVPACPCLYPKCAERLSPVCPIVTVGSSRYHGWGATCAKPGGGLQRVGLRNVSAACSSYRALGVVCPCQPNPACCHCPQGLRAGFPARVSSAGSCTGFSDRVEGCVGRPLWHHIGGRLCASFLILEKALGSWLTPATPGGAWTGGRASPGGPVRLGEGSL